MLLSNLLKDVEVLNEYNDCEVIDIEVNTKADLKDRAFVCLRGFNTDGHNFADEALKKGAVAIICEYDLSLNNQIIVKDSRKAYAIMCKHIYHDKANELFLIATTGTNGKTSVTTMIQNILISANIKTGIISTIHAQYDDYVEHLDRTTPDAHTLHRLFYEMRIKGCEAVCLEASSHALDQKRLDSCNFRIAIFTNLTQDHLDYHNNMEEYYQAKKKLFNMVFCAIINIDDEYGKRLVSEIEIPVLTYSIIDKNADFFADDIVCDNDGVSFMLHHNQIQSRVKFSIPGLYSVKNALASIAACMQIGVSLESILKAISQIVGIKGRSEVIKTQQPFHVICDFAHTPDGLENILKSTKSYAKGRVVVVFGCGGDRDKEKRPQMGAVAAKYADFIIVTSDNPRTENPKAIIGHIIKGIPANKNYIVIVDRTEAISFAIKTAKKDDIIVLAGKGHEQYQILGDKKLFYDERRVVKANLNSIKIDEALKSNE